MPTSPPTSPPVPAPRPPRPDAAVLLDRLQALAEPTRLQIVEQLAGGECCVCDLQGALDAAQSRLSFHLKKLKEAGILEDRREGRWAYYSLVPGALDEVLEGLGSLRSGALSGRVGDEGGSGCGGEGCGCGCG